MSVCNRVYVHINITACSMTNSPNLNHGTQTSWFFQFHLKHPKFFILFFEFFLYKSNQSISVAEFD